ncbi:MAG: RAMP superfamily CRISPR-associated protein [Chloroflexota bacterium]
MLTIDLKITATTDLHIGVGSSSGSMPMMLARNSRGRPCIPATTLKGLHRAAAEQMIAALGLWVCDAPIVTRMCHPLHGQINGQTACMACQIFGSPWLPGRIYYRDLVAAREAITVTRTRSAQSRQRGVRLALKTEQYEVLPAETIFTGQIQHTLTDKALLGLALAALRSIRLVGGDGGLCSVEAQALDSGKQPVSENDLADALRQRVLQAKGKP